MAEREVGRAVHALRGACAEQRVDGLVLQEIAAELDPEAAASGFFRAEWERATDEPFYPRLQAIARAVLDLDPGRRLDVLTSGTLLGQGRDGSGLGLVDAVATRKLVELLGDVASLRCAFDLCALPALQAAHMARNVGRDLRVRFVAPNIAECGFVRLIGTAVEVDVEVVAGDPLERADSGAFEAELCLPPFGVELSERSIVAPGTLERIDASGKGRLRRESVAIGDVLVHAPDARVVVVLSAGTLFRTVGAEPIARAELVDSGRLGAVCEMPPWMLFTAASVASAALVLDPEPGRRDAVRFVNLADERFVSRAARGRLRARPEVSIAAVLASPIEDDSEWARDVSVGEVRAENGILSVGRYLRTRASRALDTFLEHTVTRGLGEVVDLVRPRAVRRSDDGEHVVREAQPAHIAEDGYLGPPPRRTRLDRGALRQARHQQLRPRDLVLSIKATIGNIGIVPDDVPDEDDGFWTAGQSLIILRPREGILSEVLYEYLSNDLVQEHLESLAGGSAVRTINAKDLEALPVPVPTSDQQTRIADAFRTRRKHHAAIRRIRDAIEAERLEAWPHSSLNIKEIE